RFFLRQVRKLPDVRSLPRFSSSTRVECLTARVGAVTRTTRRAPNPMPIQPTYPGVYVQEVSSGVRTITGVSTSIAAFVGMVNRRRVNIPTRVLSFTDYERKYGSDTTVSEMTDQVRQFFFKGGQQAFIMRIANGATTSEVTVRNERDTDDVLV